MENANGSRHGNSHNLVQHAQDSIAGLLLVGTKALASEGSSYAATRSGNCRGCRTRKKKWEDLSCLSFSFWQGWQGLLISLWQTWFRGRSWKVLHPCHGPFGTGFLWHAMAHGRYQPPLGGQKSSHWPLADLSSKSSESHWTHKTHESHGNIWQHMATSFHVISCNMNSAIPPVDFRFKTPQYTVCAAASIYVQTTYMWMYSYIYVCVCVCVCVCAIHVLSLPVRFHIEFPQHNPKNGSLKYKCIDL